MKRVTWLLLGAGVLLLSACSGFIGGDTVVRISLGHGSAGRYISANFDHGVVTAVKKDGEYADNITASASFNDAGTVSLNGLIPGNYVLVVQLYNNGGNNVGLSIKEFRINKGFNNIAMEVTQGLERFGAYYSPISIDLLDFMHLPSPYTVSFAEDTLVINNFPRFPEPDYVYLNFNEAFNGSSSSGSFPDITFTSEAGEPGVVSWGFYSYLRVIFRE